LAYSSAHQADGVGGAVASSSASSASEDDDLHRHIYGSSSSSANFSGGQSGFSIASSDLTIATRSLSDLAQVPDIAARLIGPVKKELSKDVILNARLAHRHFHGTGVPVEQETDFATAASPLPESSSPSAALVNATPAEESPRSAAAECSLTHIELTDDHIRVVFDRACEDYSRWAALASPYAQIPSDRIPEWLVPVDALNLTCVGGGCTILLERSRLRSHLLSNAGGRPDLFIASEEDNNNSGSDKQPAGGKGKIGGGAAKPSRDQPSKPSSAGRENTPASQKQKKQARKETAFPPAPS